MAATRPLEERFWEKVNKSGPLMPGMKTRCWVWTAATDGCGYGLIGLGPGKGVGKASRVAWSFCHGPLEEGECALHRCDNPPCVREDHLFKGTQKDNADDRERKSRGNQPRGKRNGRYTKPERTARGHRHGNAVLTAEQVRIIRRCCTGRYGEQRRLAKEYGVDVQTIRRVVQRKTYTEEG